MGSPKIMHFGYFSIKRDPIFHCSCFLILGVFGVKCLDFGTYSVFELFNYLMPKSGVGYGTKKCYKLACMDGVKT
jgi:hypothetical protein